MKGNFTFNNPTRLHFGKASLAKLSDELMNYGPNVMLTYGGGSVKKEQPRFTATKSMTGTNETQSLSSFHVILANSTDAIKSHCY